MEVPIDIFRRTRKKRLEIPNTLFANNRDDIPNRIVIKYKGF